MMNRVTASFLCLVVLCLYQSQPLAAETINLWGIADGNTTYIEQQSAAFFRMDLYDPPPRQTQQRFHDINDPSITYGVTSFDGFPNDANFRLGTVTYDGSALVNGSGIASITGLTLGISCDPNDPSYVNYGRWTDITTTVNSFSGNVTVAAGQPTGINLASEVSLLVWPFAPSHTISFPASGYFNVTGDAFDGYISGVTTGTSLAIWDFQGTLTTLAVPEPGTFTLLFAGVPLLLAGSAIVRRHSKQG